MVPRKSSKANSIPANISKNLVKTKISKFKIQVYIYIFVFTLDAIRKNSRTEMTFTVYRRLNALHGAS